MEAVLPSSFTTARLLTERLDERHLAEVARMNADPRVMDWLGAPSVVAYTMPHNARSRRVLEKLGFAYERDIIHDDLPHVLYRRRR